MIAVSAKDIAASENQQIRHFQQSLSPYLLERFSSANYQLAPQNTKAFVDRHFSQAKHYGFETTRDIRSFIELSFVLGVNFEKDPQLAWASQILLNPQYSPWEKITKLQKRAQFHLERVLECGVKFPIKPYQQLRTKYFDILQQSNLQAGQVLSLFACFWPKKAETLNSATHSILLNKQSPLSSILSQNEIITLAFLLGFEFDTNPRYPWAQYQSISGTQIWAHLDHLFGKG